MEQKFIPSVEEVKAYLKYNVREHLLSTIDNLSEKQARAVLLDLQEFEGRRSGEKRIVISEIKIEGHYVTTSIDATFVLSRRSIN